MTVTGNNTLAATFTAIAGPGNASRIETVVGDSQRGPVNQSLPLAPVVRVVDFLGNPVPGVGVSFSTVLTGRVAHPAVTTDSAGRASPGLWTLGTQSGFHHLRVQVGATALQVEFTGFALPGPAALVRFVSLRDNQSLPTGYRLFARDLPFFITDEFENAVDGIWAHFQVSAGVVRPESTLIAGGLVSFDEWQLGGEPGPQTISISAGAARHVLTMFAHAGRILTRITGDSQVVVVATEVPVPPSVRVTDSTGLPVAGVSVQFSTPSDFSDGFMRSADPAIISSDADGIAIAPEWTVGQHTSFPSRLQVEATGLAGSPISFTTRLLPGPPSRFSAGYPSTPQGEVGQAFTPDFFAILQDAYENGVSGVPIAWSLTAGGGSVDGADTVTSATGEARPGRLTLGIRPGANRLVLRTPVISDSAVFVVTGVAGPVHSVVVLDGDGQTGPARQPLPVAPQVRVEDPYGNSMAGVQVEFFVSGGGGRVGLGSVLTDPAGIAIEPSWILGPFPGTQTLRAIAGPGVYADLSATALAPPPASATTLAGGGQSVRSGTSLPIPLAVLVRDATGLGSAGITVNYAIRSGGGTLATTSAVTDTGGIARLSGWVPGPGANVVEASIIELPAQTAAFLATGQAPDAPFDITMIPLGSVSAGVQGAFTDAAARWRSIVVGDVPDQPLDLPANSCFTGQPAFSGTVDDLLLYFLIASIDGPGGILGGAGVCVYRAGTGMPAVAVIQLDLADVTGLGNYLPDVVLHEFGHALGVGSGWARAGLVLGAGGPSPVFIGPAAQQAYWMVKGANGPLRQLSIESSGPVGTRDVHWAENALHSELMTPYIDYPPNPLSLVTTSSLQDLGYSVDNNAADLGTTFLRAGPAGFRPPIPLRESPWTGPVFEITPTGELIPR